MLLAHVTREKAEEQAMAERELTERIVGASHGSRASTCGVELELFERELDCCLELSGLGLQRGSTRGR
jgi:hypothetical protein